ncbi:hypothetical protein ACFOVU_03015 [Nocardiopsis sediminis]|uniref:Uncharacterized protein n=1 Tax=Nocardiopsis sediminis TaxID=1778267 RepID=A0ABV8FFG8_9ACTN
MPDPDDALAARTEMPHDADVLVAGPMEPDDDTCAPIAGPL